MRRVASGRWAFVLGYSALLLCGLSLVAATSGNGLCLSKAMTSHDKAMNSFRAAETCYGTCFVSCKQ